MKRIIGGIIAAGLTLTGCTSTTGATVTNTPAKAAAGTHAATTHATTAAAAPRKAHVGDTITIPGATAGDALQVELVAVDRAAKATDQFSTPTAGNQYYAAEWKLTNTGTGAFSDALGNDSTVQDTAGHSFQTDIVGSVSSGPLFTDQTNIAVGGSALGWIVYQVTAGDTIAGAQFTLDAGMGNTGQWLVP